MDISKLNLISYSMLVNNIDTSKKKNKSEFNYINLEKLVNNFELDFTFDSNV